MPLPHPADRKPSHTRTVVYRGYDRADGLWDIEAELADVKAFDFPIMDERTLKKGEPMHGMSIRLSFDSELLIHEVATSMHATPHDLCQHSQYTMQRLLGCRMGKGWRRQVEEKVGGVAGCTHLREMLFGIATAAMHTLASGEWLRRETSGEPHPVETEPPAWLDQCHTWDSSGSATEHHYPMFYRPARTEA